MNFHLYALVLLSSSLASALPAIAEPIFFSTGNPDGQLAAASRPSSSGQIEIEAADDFVLSKTTTITSATFTGLLTNGTSSSNVSSVSLEIYRVFPLDSNLARTVQVPTRVNSPSDVALMQITAGSGLSFATTAVSMFTANNSVLNGIQPSPGQMTGGEGPVSGTEVTFNLSFIAPFTLDPGHYFFVPQVDVAGGEFFWISAPRPIVAPGTPFPSGATDLQAWIRNENLDPDWLRIGTDIVDAGTFNMAFSISGVEAVPEPSTWSMIFIGFAALGVIGFRRKHVNALCAA